MQPLQDLPRRVREVGGVPVEEEGGLVEEPLRRLDVLEDDGLRQPLELRLLLAREVLARVDDDRQRAEARPLLDALDHLQARDVGQEQVQHHAVEVLVVEDVERLLAGGDRGDLHVAIADQVDHALALNLVVLHHQQVLHLPLDEGLDRALDRAQRLLVGLGIAIGVRLFAQRLLAFLHGVG